MRTYWVAPIPPFYVADGTALASSTSLTAIEPAPPVVIPANMLEQGSQLEFHAFGRYSNTGTPTLTLGVYLGNVATAIAATSALTTVSGVTNRTWKLHGIASVRSNGSSGTIIGAFEVLNVTSGAVDLAPATAPVTAAIDTTTAQRLSLGATWGTSSASNTITCHYFGVRLVN